MDAPRQPDDASRASGVLRVAFLLFVGGWGANHFVSLLPLYRAALDLSAAEASIVFGVYALGLVPSLVLGGPLSDRVGRRRVVAIAVLTATLGGIVLALGRASFSGLLVGRFIVGLGSGATFSAGSAWLVDRLGEEGASSRAAGATIALSAGFGGGPLFAAGLSALGVGPLVVPYVVQAVAALAALALVASVVDTRRAPLATHPEASPAHALTGSASPSRGARARLAVVAPWVFGFPCFAMVVLPAAVRDQLGAAAPAFAGACAASALVPGAIVQRATGKLSPRVQSRLGLLLGALGVLVGGTAAGYGSVAGVWAAAPLLGAGHGLTFASGMRTAVSSASPAGRGRAVGVFYGMAYAGFAAPYAFAALSERIGALPAFVVFASVAAATALVRLGD
jgi:hypothetical protein